MNRVRQTYILHAEIVRGDSPSDEFDDARAGHPLERRLNRIERVAATFSGHIQLRFSNGMRMLFLNPESALLGACEMQSRCALLPQVAQHRMSLRIGIECQHVRERQHDALEALPEATRLAVLDDGIVVAPCLVGALPKEFHDLLRPLSAHLAGTLADRGSALYKSVDWRSRNAGSPNSETASQFVESAPPPLYLTLMQGENTLTLTADDMPLTIGRDPKRGLCIDDIHSSRHHCRIDYVAGALTLTDTSTNGTTVIPEQGEPRIIKKAFTPLTGRGILLFGRPLNNDRRGGMRYEVR